MITPFKYTKSLYELIQASLTKDRPRGATKIPVYTGTRIMTYKQIMAQLN